MILAIEAMDPTTQGVLYLLAIVLAGLDAVGVALPRVAFFPLAFAVFAVPFAWNAFAAS